MVSLGTYNDLLSCQLNTIGKKTLLVIFIIKDAGVSGTGKLQE